MGKATRVGQTDKDSAIRSTTDKLDSSEHGIQTRGRGVESVRKLSEQTMIAAH